MSTYNLTYIISNIFLTYVLYRAMHIFYGNHYNGKESAGKTNYTVTIHKTCEFLSYAAYFAVISFIHVVVRVPMITLISNIIIMFIITFNYEIKILRNVLITLLVLSIFFCAETIIVALTENINLSTFSLEDFNSPGASVIIKLFTFLIVLLLERFQNLRNGEKINFSYWMFVLLIPAGSIVIIIILFNNHINYIEFTISTTLILAVNMLAFYAYDKILIISSSERKAALMQQQNEYYRSQFQLMTASNSAIRSVRHDMKNHLIALNSMIENNKNEDALEYVKNAMENVSFSGSISNTGNLEIDSIINYKYPAMLDNDIDLRYTAEIPEDLQISPYDMTIILGNLLDNAMHAVKSLAGKRYISLTIKYNKGRLLFKITNPFDGELKEKNNHLVSLKSSSPFNGIGLENVKAVVQKYDGAFHYSTADNIFTVSIILYCND